ncbi:hypothetical protein T492DRAFT_1075341 [Pavlovales sp. CCMP2436]|nr:hypothetical protein T492DRAFT_1075341 [Pavlovales sp. CCMP2436]
MCLSSAARLHFPREYQAAYSLNYAVFVASFVGLVGIGFPLALVASSPGTSLAFVGVAFTCAASSIIMCCGPQQRGQDGRCQLIAAIAFNAIAALMHFISVWLIIWSWDVVSRELGRASCSGDVTKEECDAAIAQVKSIVAGLLWTTWLYVVFVCGLDCFAAYTFFKALTAMKYAATLPGPGAGPADFYQQPPVEAFPVVNSTVVEGGNVQSYGNYEQRNVQSYEQQAQQQQQPAPAYSQPYQQAAPAYAQAYPQDPAPPPRDTSTQQTPRV